ncbi:MAG: ornithine--oxo-acid transaminase [Planctomycetes bacterium]|jgi:ornithine--oxo-acid transaminase|nr:ornithine--oxo-acid transaminase [Planctomycetota bacterium]
MPLSSRDCIDLESTYGASNYHPLPVVISRAEGAWVFDPEGRKYLDCLAAYSALNQGYGHPKILAAVREQLGTGVTLTSRAFYNDKLGLFLKRICRIAGFEKALPMNTGAEAVETAIKLARKHAVKVRGIPEGQAEILVFSGNFHGRTTTIVGFSDEPQYREGFGPFTPGFRLVPYGDAEAVRQALGPRTAAVLIEPIQGEAGIIIPPRGYLREVAAACRQSGALLVLDEIQSGLGRTGKMFAYEHEGIRPDVLILAKAISGGILPVSVVLADEAVMSVFRPGDHGSTYGGNPLGAAAALAALDVLVEERLCERAAELGDYLRQGLSAIPSPHVKEVRGVGLWIGVEIHGSSGRARPFSERLLAEGVLCKETHDQVIRFAPPLVVTKEDLDFLLQKARRVLTA